MQDGTQFSHDQDTLAMKQQNLEMALISSEKFCTKLDKEYERLIEEKEVLQADLTLHEERQQKLIAQREELNIPKDQEVYVTGDYFHRINALEVNEALFKGALEGHKVVVKRISDEVNAQQMRNQRLQKRLDRLLEKLPDGALVDDRSQDPELHAAILSRRFGGSEEMRQLQQKLDEYRDMIYDLQEECERIRSEVRQKSARLQMLPKDAASALLAQKEDLEADINLKKEELRQILIEETSLKSKASLAMNKVRQNAERMEKDDTWESERRTLMAAITHAKTEIRSLKSDLGQTESRPISRLSTGMSDARRSARRKDTDSLSVRSGSTMSSREPVQYTERTLRLAMQAELDTICSPDHPVMMAIDNEAKYGRKMAEELDIIKCTTKRIAVFEKKTFGKLEDDDVDPDDNMREQRLDALRKEYEELRLELQRFQ